MNTPLIRTALAFVALSACTADILPGERGGPENGGSNTTVPKSVLPITVTPSSPQLRLLSATEYRRTVRDLLGLSVTTPLGQADWTAGFDNGAGILADDNLHSALVDEAEKLATGYLSSRASADFPCFNPSAITDGCVKDLISKLGRRAWRRPLNQAQRDELFVFFQSVSSAVGNDKLTAGQVLVARLVSAPQFLYRSEVGRPTRTRGNDYHLDDFEKASLLSYTLTGSMPDEALLADAEARLLDDAGLRRHIRRLWATPAARERMGDFFRQWLKVTRLDDMAQRPSAYPKLPTPALGASLKAEFDAFVSAVVFDHHGSVPSLFTESFTIADANTAPLYGSEPPSVPTRIVLDPTQRKGVLTLASTMAALGSTDDPGKDRPVVRGLMVKEQLLCEEVGPPSGIDTIAAANAAQQNNPNFAQLTTREQYEAMMQQGANCQSCHQQFMPLGFALGRYDALGQHRIEQRGRPIDATVHAVPFAGIDRTFVGGTELADALGASPRAVRCFSENFIHFATGTARNAHTETLNGSLMQKWGTGTLAIGRLVEEVLASPHLYTRRGAKYVQPKVATTTLLLARDGALQPDDAVVSSDGEFRLTYQLDGNLVLYRASGGAVWASNSAGTNPGFAVMQGDGNLVVYDSAKVPRFNTGTHGNPDSALHIDANGTLYVISPGGQRLWSSGGTP